MQAPVGARATGAAAVLIATAAAPGGGPAAAQPSGDSTLLERLCGELARLGVADVTVVTRAEWLHELRAPDGVRVSAVADADEERRLVRELAAGGAAPLVARAEAIAGPDTLAEALDRARLDAAVKADDSFFTTFLVSPYSRHVARWAARRGLTPNAVTTASLGLGLLAAAAFATGQRPGLVAGAVLLQVAFAADCVDGQLARYTRTFSPFGAWLDSMFDRTKEYAVYAGLALGAATNVWPLAAGALALQTSRHMLQVSWAEVVPRTAGARRRSGRTIWLRKAIVLPIGERFAAISLAAALAGPRTVFVVLLVWGGVAAAYEIAGRLARSLR